MLSREEMSFALGGITKQGARRGGYMVSSCNLSTGKSVTSVHKIFFLMVSIIGNFLLIRGCLAKIETQYTAYTEREPGAFPAFQRVISGAASTTGRYGHCPRVRGLLQLSQGL